MSIPFPHPDDWSKDTPECTCLDYEPDYPCRSHDFCTCGTEADWHNWPLPGPWCDGCARAWCSVAAVVGLMGMAEAIRFGQMIRDPRTWSVAPDYPREPDWHLEPDEMKF